MSNLESRIEAAPPEVKQIILNTVGMTSRDKVLYYLYGPIHCENCGKHILPYPRYLGAKTIYCSRKCGFNSTKRMAYLKDPEVINKRIKTQYEKYGSLAANTPENIAKRNRMKNSDSVG